MQDPRNNVTAPLNVWTLACVIALCGCSGKLMDDEDAPPAERPEDGVGAGGAAEPVVPDAPKSGACADPVRDPGPTVARRLTRWEYVNTLRDTLGIDMSSEAAALPPELRSAGLFNTAKDLLATLERVTLWNELASQAAAKIPDLGAFVAAHTSCRRFEATCEDEFIERLGTKLFRRPVPQGEAALFNPLFREAAACGMSFDEGAKAVLEAMLQSPRFLYRIEDQTTDAKGSFRALDAWEMANRLSYLVTGSAPDEALVAAAKAGALSSPAARIEHVRRLSKSKAALDTALRFVSDWLTLDDLDTAVRARDRFPLWNDRLRADMKEEALRMVEEVLFTQKRPLSALLTHEETTLTPGLAELYGLQPSGSGWQRYDLKGVAQRRGILSTAAVLLRSGSTADAAMVARSLFLYHNFLCQDVAGPPPGTVTADPPEIAGNSKRDRAERRLADPKCGSCHQQFEPLAFVFEPYDGIGAYKATDEGGHVTRTDGVIPSAAGPIAYANLDDYVEALIAHPDVAACLVKKPFQFAIGRALEELDTCTLEDLSRALARTDGSYAEFLEVLVSHPVFSFVRRE